ncbi:MAG TPA: hypothetical protein VJP79_09145 [Nitrososphaera sp.]|nr:hypothetical protein [Nitrososphaera sp.]
MRSEKDIRLRIDLLESQSSSIARILSKAINERNEAAFAEHSERLASNRGRIEELRWILGEKAGQSILDLQIASMKSGETVRQTLERLKSGEITMADLPSDAQAMVRKGALELQGLNRS